MGILRTSSIYAFASIVSQLTSFMILPIYTTALTISEFGVLSMIETYVFFFMAISSLAVERAAQRFFYEESIAEKAFDFALSIIFIWGGLVSVLLWILHSILGFNLYQLGGGGVLLFFVVGIGQNIAALAQVYFQVNQKPLHYLGFVLLKVILIFLSVYWFLIHERVGVLGYLYSYAITFFVLSVFSIWSMRNFNIFSSISSLDGRLISKKFMQFSLPFVPTILCGWVISMSGRIILDEFSSSENVAIYALGFKLSTSFFLVSSALSMALAPILFESLSKKGESCNKTLKMIDLSNVFLSLCGGGFILFGGDLFSPFFSVSYQESFSIVSLLVFSHYISGYMGLTSNNYLSFYKKTSTQMICFLISATLNLLISILLAPIFGVFGVVAASISSMVILIILHHMVLVKFSLPRFNYYNLAVGLIVLLIASVFNQLFPNSIWNGGYTDFGVRLSVLTLLIAIVFYLHRDDIKILTTTTRAI